MKVRLKVSGLLVIILFLFCCCSCRNSVKVESKDNLLDEEVQKYSEENNIDFITGWVGEKFQIFSFIDKKDFGMVGFFLNDTTNEIKILKNTRNKEAANNVDYLQLQDVEGHKVYVGVFIFDDELAERGEDVKITFGNTKLDKPFKISITSYGEKSVIIDYSSNEIREIESVILSDKNGNEIY